MSDSSSISTAEMPNMLVVGGIEILKTHFYVPGKITLEESHAVEAKRLPFCLEDLLILHASDHRTLHALSTESLIFELPASVCATMLYQASSQPLTHRNPVSWDRISRNKARTSVTHRAAYVVF